MFLIILEQVARMSSHGKYRSQKISYFVPKICEALASIKFSNILLTKAAHVTGTNVSEGGKHPSP